jgi:UDPglucose 6-dehydrogenase
MLATRISFMNELSVLANKLGANIDKVREGIGSDSRIGGQFLRAGIGFGGSCFPKDIRALLKMGEEQAVPLSIVQSAHDANERQKRVLAQMVREHFGGSLKGLTVALWGLSFKPETDDIRESPAIEVARELVRAGASVRAFDPEAMDNARNHLGLNINFVDTKEDALVGANALVLATEWCCFGSVDFTEVRRYMEGHVVFDGRNVWDQEAVTGAGLSYYGIGRPQCVAPVANRANAQVA